MASEVYWKISSSPTSDSQSVIDMRCLRHYGDFSKKSFYVKNIPSSWDDWRIFHVFRQFGLVNNVVLPDLKTAHSESAYRYGFVEMISLAGAENLLKKLKGSGNLFVDGLCNPLQVQRTAARTKSTPSIETHSSDLQDENLEVRKLNNMQSANDEGKNFERILSEPIKYTKWQLLDICSSMSRMRIPKITIEEILL